VTSNSKKKLHSEPFHVATLQPWSYCRCQVCGGCWGNIMATVGGTYAAGKGGTNIHESYVGRRTLRKETPYKV